MTRTGVATQQQQIGHFRLVPELERTVVGQTTIVTAEGRVHLSFVGEEEVEVLVALTDGLGCAEFEERFGSTGCEIVDDLRAAGLLVGSSAPVEPRVALTSAGVEFAGFDRFVAVVHRSWPGGPSRVLTCVAVVVAIGGLVATLLPPSFAGARFPATTALLVLLVVSLIATMVHETAHALVVHHHGRRVGRAGFGFYWGEVSFFVDATDAYFLPKRVRVAQTLIGPASDAVIAGAFAIGAHLVVDDRLALLFHQVALSGWIVVLVNVAPVLKLDGYWAVSDLLEAPDLHAQSWRAIPEVARGSRDRRTLLLGGNAVVSALAGVLAIATSIMVWKHHYLSMVGGSWGAGFGGKVVAVGFVLPTVAGLVVAAAQLFVWLAGRLRVVDRREVSHEVQAPYSSYQPHPSASVSSIGRFVWSGFDPATRTRSASAGLLRPRASAPTRCVRQQLD